MLPVHSLNFRAKSNAYYRNAPPGEIRVRSMAVVPGIFYEVFLFAVGLIGTI